MQVMQHLGISGRSISECLDEQNNKTTGKHKRTDAAIRFGESTKSNNCKAVGIKKLKI